MKEYKAFLIDLDGTTYFGKQRIPSAESFIRRLLDLGLPFLFVTNNATKSVEEIKYNLNVNYDLAVEDHHIYSSRLALLDYLKQHHPCAKLYVVGEQSLKDKLIEGGFEIIDQGAADVVVQALDRQADYQDLARAVQLILAGAEFITTNTDRLIPTEEGLMPSSGALTAFISYATGVEPVVMGKPHAPIIDGALKRLAVAKDEVLLIGDNYQTDIQAGIQAGIDSLMVLTGVTRPEEVPSLPISPTYVMNSLAEYPLEP